LIGRLVAGVRPLARLAGLPLSWLTAAGLLARLPSGASRLAAALLPAFAWLLARALLIAGLAAFGGLLVLAWLLALAGALALARSSFALLAGAPALAVRRLSRAPTGLIARLVGLPLPLSGAAS
jgi:hypothetical protein